MYIVQPYNSSSEGLQYRLLWDKNPWNIPRNSNVYHQYFTGTWWVWLNNKITIVSCILISSHINYGVSYMIIGMISNEKFTWYGSPIIPSNYCFIIMYHFNLLSNFSYHFDILNRKQLEHSINYKWYQ